MQPYSTEAGGGVAVQSREVVLSLSNVHTYFFTDAGVVKAVNGVDYQILSGETLGVVGESGCGKSVTAMSVMRLIPDPPGRITEGEILFNGRNLLALSESEMRRIRGNDIGMIFQEPMTSLNPVYTVGDQIMEAVMLHRGLRRKDARAAAIDMLEQVGIPDPASRVDNYPHEMSGGMKQRVMIAMALSCDPAVLIADEPTTALDVTIQAQILDLMRKLQRSRGMSILLITHDLAVIAEMAHHVAVMYAGRVVEFADTKTLFDDPRHPYTLGLFKSIPKLGERKDRLDTIPGTVPNPLNFPKGCKFSNRCQMITDAVRERCNNEEPPERDLGSKHTVCCWLFEE